MIRLIPLLDAPVALDGLSGGLAAHMRASGLPLPEDHRLLDTIRLAARHGDMEAVLAVQNDTALGIAAWRLEDGTGYLRLLYTLPGASEAAARGLLAYAMGLLRTRATGGIYSELPEVPPAVQGALAEWGFVGAQRFLMRADLAARDWPVTLPGGYAVLAWDNGHLDDAARIIYLANVGTLDAFLIPELRTHESTRTIVRQTLLGQYGDFDAQASGMIVTAEGEPAAVTLTTRRENGQGFTAEICVHPDHRRRGLGRALMCRAHGVFLAEGMTQGLLGVTAGNPARQLYESLGYREIGSVWTYLWPRPEGWPS